ncbi:hypothetical protein T265_11600, partial [Opisthorchis viverrini]
AALPIPIVLADTSPTPFCDALWVQIPLRGSDSLLLEAPSPVLLAWTSNYSMGPKSDRSWSTPTKLSTQDARKTSPSL